MVVNLYDVFYIRKLIAVYKLSFIMKKSVVLLSLLFLAGCSTAHTIANAKKGVTIEGSYCSHINHVMSGVAYNWCKIDGEPNDTGGFNTEQSFERIATETTFSILTDILVLPYTIYKQLTAEPIAVHSKKN